METLSRMEGDIRTVPERGEMFSGEFSVPDLSAENRHNVEVASGVGS